jgi:hypothetical protein
MQLILATEATLGLIVIFPSELISLSSGFNVTNSASIATMSPEMKENNDIFVLFTGFLCVYLA